MPLYAHPKRDFDKHDRRRDGGSATTQCRRNRAWSVLDGARVGASADAVAVPVITTPDAAVRQLRGRVAQEQGPEFPDRYLRAFRTPSSRF